jgi:hypothetical protein
MAASILPAKNESTKTKKGERAARGTGRLSKIT